MARRLTAAQAAEIAALRTRFAAIDAVNEPTFAPDLDGYLAEAKPAAEVANPGDYEDIAHQKGNPVRRVQGAPSTASMLDLEMERGMLAVRKSGIYGLQCEYEHMAPVVSYLFDDVVCLEGLVVADDIPEERRKGLKVVVGSLRGVLTFATTVLDLLKLKGEKKDSKALIQAVEDRLRGAAGVPIDSDLVLGIYSDYITQLRSQQVKQAAQQQVQTTKPARDRPSTRSGGGTSSEQQEP